MLTVESSQQKSDHFLVLKTSWPGQSEPIPLHPFLDFPSVQRIKHVELMCIIEMWLLNRAYQYNFQLSEIRSVAKSPQIRPHR